MKIISIIIFFLLLTFDFCLCENNSEYYIRKAKVERQRSEEILRAHELKKLELQYKIYYQELEMQKNEYRNIYVNAPYTKQKTAVEVEVEVNQKMSIKNKNRKGRKHGKRR